MLDAMTSFLNLGATGNAGAMTVSGVARAFDTPFRPSLERPVLVQYVVSLTSTNTDLASVELRVGGSPTPSVPRAYAAVLTTSATESITTVSTLTALVLPGEYVDIANVSTNPADATLVVQTETVL